MTAQDTKMLEYLRGLNDMGLELSEKMAAQLEALQEKEQKASASKVLSHGHLNRLRKLKSQVDSAAKKLTELDQEWVKFMGATMCKMHQHAQMYQNFRADLLESFNQKLSELHAIKREVSAASQSLVSQPLENVCIPEAPAIDQQLQQMQEQMQQDGLVSQVPDSIDLISEAEMEDSGEEKTQFPKVSKKASHQKSFRSATSPTKVAQQHLKAKAQDTREGKQKEKEDK